MRVVKTTAMDPKAGMTTAEIREALHDAPDDAVPAVIINWRGKVKEISYDS